VRGQVSWAMRDAALALPPCPVNGNGHFLPAVPLEGGLAWMSGSSYGRGDTDLQPRSEDHRANFDRIGALLPMVAAQLAPAFASGKVRAWTGIRCASSDRRPLVGELAPGLWVSTAMGSRGLSFAALCAEMIACRLHAQPLPLPLSLAMALDVNR
jgi:tRNA 5-methylaminomethyl-2-thiouridine biosynthesis bifunctional protein